MSTQPSTAGFDKRKSIVLGIIGLAVIVLIFWKVIPQIGSYSEALDAIKAMSTMAIVIIVAAVIAYLAVYGLPFMAAAPGLGFWESERVNQAAFAISNGIPGGGAIGLAVQFGMLATAGIAAAAATAAITAVGLWSTFVTLGFPILGVVAAVVAGVDGGKYATIALIGLVVLVAAVVAFVLVMRSEPLAVKVGNGANRVMHGLSRFHASWATVDLVGPITSFRSNMYDLLRLRWKHITAAQVAVSFTQFLILFVALRGIEGWDKQGVSPLLVFAAFAISQLGLMIPITPGGLGTVDAFMIGMLVTFGVPHGDATAAALVWRAASYVPQIVIGIIALVSWYRRAGQALAKA